VAFAIAEAKACAFPPPVELAEAEALAVEEAV
jgi:hypothetical protein